MNDLNIIKTNQFLNPNNSLYRFALDDDDLPTLKIIIDNILSAEPIEFLYFICYDELLKDLNNNKFTYSDSIVILTNLTINEIDTLFFEQGKNIKPSDVEQYSEDILSTTDWGNILNFIHQEEINLNIEHLKVLYWD